MVRARRSSLLQRQPTSLAWRSPHTSPIGKPAKTNMQLLRPETGGSDFGKVLQFEEYFAVCTFSISLNYGFSFPILFSQGYREGKDSNKLFQLPNLTQIH